MDDEKLAVKDINLIDEAFKILENNINYEETKFNKLWFKVINTLVDAHFEGNLSIKRILILAAKHYEAIIKEHESYLDLFKVREFFKTQEYDLEEYLWQKDMVEHYIKDFKDKICQAIEGIEGANSEVPLLRPSLNSPGSLFSDAYLLTKGLLSEDL